MGMVLSMEENEDPWWRTRSRSWECSRSIEDIASGVDQVTALQQAVRNVCGAIDGLAQAPGQGRAGLGKIKREMQEVRANDQAVRRSSAWV
jgi:hypothetical protein